MADAGNFAYGVYRVAEDPLILDKIVTGNRLFQTFGIFKMFECRRRFAVVVTKVLSA